MWVDRHATHLSGPVVGHRLSESINSHWKSGNRFAAHGLPPATYRLFPKRKQSVRNEIVIFAPSNVMNQPKENTNGIAC
ncbi:hypothetical protein BFP76_09240 [Amylibacter kogurei]|uniref:Uncharacterized protein n=1 Tax=Paramylibacter kogurei TaxID=1889778 RepID=A0A2G5K2F1_9RHOB|nr:hypothetical protein BFP76_09240 [Amylibacter kogurei]